MNTCPFCQFSECYLFHSDKRREYYRCLRCALVFVDPRFFLSVSQEKAEYDRHENDVYDNGYRKFLSRLAVPMMEGLPNSAQGLDFGCGPGPALVHMFKERGFEMAAYDPFYSPDATVLSKQYDFICATEVVEHLHQPFEVWQSLWSMLASGGVLGIMTKLVLSKDAFASWHYKNDLTHVCFYSKQTLNFWAARHGALVRYLANDAFLIVKP